MDVFLARIDPDGGSILEYRLQAAGDKMPRWAIQRSGQFLVAEENTGEEEEARDIFLGRVSIRDQPPLGLGRLL